MTRDQLTELAARVTDTSIPIHAFTLDELVDFADAIITEEREACALVCEAITASWTEWEYNESCMECARAIRARDNP